MQQMEETEEPHCPPTLQPIHPKRLAGNMEGRGRRVASAAPCLGGCQSVEAISRCMEG